MMYVENSRKNTESTNQTTLNRQVPQKMKIHNRENDIRATILVPKKGKN